MKHTLFILALITATIQTFAQSPRIKLNQITKDTISGSVLVSSPTDSGMVYSRDLFISYGADTVLILGGDTLAATSSIISSVLSDGVTITGDGTTGSELTVDTVTVIATKEDLNSYYLDSNPDGYTSNTGTVTSVGGTGTVNGISLSGTVTSSGDLTLGGTLSGVDLASQVTGTLPVANGGTGSDTTNFVDLSSAQTVGGAKTFTSTVTGTRFDPTSSSATGNGMFLPTTNTLGFSTNGSEKMRIDANGNLMIGGTSAVGRLRLFSANTNSTGFNDIADFTNGVDVGFRLQITGISETDKRASFGTVTPSDFVITTNNTERIRITSSGNVLISDLAGTGTRTVEATSNGTLQAPSTMMIKENIEQSSYGLSTINNLNPVTFYYKDKEIYGSVRDIGFLAEEVYQILPEASGQNADGSYYLDKSKITPVLTKAIQEQQTIIETQSTEIETLKKLITDLSNRLQILENN